MTQQTVNRKFIYIYGSSNATFTVTSEIVDILHKFYYVCHKRVKMCKHGLK